MTKNPDAERTLGAFFATSLDEAARAEEPIAFDRIAAYVDGQLDDVDREIFESRLALDPALQAEVADLTAMRAALAQQRQEQPARRQTTPPQASAKRSRGASSSMLWVIGALAAAASLTVAAVWVARTRLQQSSAVSEQTSEQTSAQQTTPPAQPPTPLRIAMNDAGGTIGLDAAGKLTAASLSASRPVLNLSDSTARDATAALQNGTLPSTSLPRELRSSGPLTLMGGDSPTHASFGVIAPVATLVREARPTFRWQPLAAARAYKVAIYTDRLERVAASPEITGTSWTPEVDLKAGTTYQWQVTALTPGAPTLTPAPPQPEARFQVLDPAQRQALDRQLAEAGSSNLLRALAFTRAGLLDDADAAFSALAAANPTSPLARDLIANAHRLRAQK